MMTHAIAKPSMIEIQCIIITNYKNPNFTRCLEVGLEGGTF